MRPAPVSRLAAVLACAAACAGGAAPLGTLFHTPQERERLDRLRRGEVVAAPEAAGASEPARKREITGYVKRSDGRGTAFIDGVPLPVDPKTAPLLQPDKVPAYAGRTSDNLKIERKDTR
jgi:hypothetical protein